MRNVYQFIYLFRALKSITGDIYIAKLFNT